MGWLFDGLDMHLYVLIAAPFVAGLLGVADQKDPQVGFYSSWIQAAFLFGWALGGGFFGRIADRIGRSRALMLTILTYAMFTGLSYFAQTWWQLMIFRFLAALGIGGEWAVGASLLSETWPRAWRPWMAAVLQTAVNLGVMLAGLANFLLLGWAGYPHRTVFLVGVLPAFIVLWIRRAVPEPEEWQGAKQKTGHVEPRFLDLFRGPVRRISVLTLLVCSFALTAHWAFLFWYLQHLRNLPELNQWNDAEKSQLVSRIVWLVIGSSIVGNFLAAALARWLKYRRAIACLCVGYFLALMMTYGTPLELRELWYGLAVIGLCQGVFGLFTMYLPPLFPTLLRTTGAGFCYNFGRIAAGVGTVLFGLFTEVGDYRLALFYAGFLFIPAAAIALLMPEPPDEEPAVPVSKEEGRVS
ncbi:MFS transporter [Zavarzinella formosa]|uniref:MFS transporter n=1 Tax=Zavarzinella formosa TaxID=360055 RepID=UPI0002DA4F8C|nr:MFS transporter [Zavarzinella formosa]